MAETKKKLSEYDYQQVIQKTYNSESGTLAVDGFLVGKVGRKVDLVISQTTIADDTETYTFSEDAVNLFALTLIYTDGTRETLLSAERTA